MRTLSWFTITVNNMISWFTITVNNMISFSDLMSEKGSDNNGSAIICDSDNDRILLIARIVIGMCFCLNCSLSLLANASKELMGFFIRWEQPHRIQN